MYLRTFLMISTTLVHLNYVASNPNLPGLNGGKGRGTGSYAPEMELNLRFYDFQNLDMNA